MTVSLSEGQLLNLNNFDILLHLVDRPQKSKYLFFLFLNSLLIHNFSLHPTQHPIFYFFDSLNSQIIIGPRNNNSSSEQVQHQIRERIFIVRVIFVEVRIFDVWMFVEVLLQSFAFEKILLFVELEVDDDFDVEVAVYVGVYLVGNRGLGLGIMGGLGLTSLGFWLFLKRCALFWLNWLASFVD